VSFFGFQQRLNVALYINDLLIFFLLTGFVSQLLRQISPFLQILQFYIFIVYTRVILPFQKANLSHFQENILDLTIKL